METRRETKLVLDAREPALLADRLLEAVRRSYLAYSAPPDVIILTPDQETILCEVHDNLDRPLKQLWGCPVEVRDSE